MARSASQVPLAVGAVGELRRDTPGLPHFTCPFFELN